MTTPITAADVHTILYLRSKGMGAKRIKDVLLVLHGRRLSAKAIEAVYSPATEAKK